MNQTCKIALTLLTGFVTVSSYAGHDNDFRQQASFLNITNKCNNPISISGYFLTNVNWDSDPILAKKTFKISPNSGKSLVTLFGYDFMIKTGSISYNITANSATNHTHITTVDKEGKCLRSS